MFDKKTITDFGNQFQIDNKIDGYFGNISLLRDVVRPFVLNKIKNKTVMEIGSGSGRILKNLITFKPKNIFAIEPSKAIYIAKRNNPNQKKIIFVKKPAQKIKYINFFDYVFSLGVIHHIPQDLLVVKNIYRSLKKGGKFVFWVYGYENNEIYLLFINCLRRITVLLPDFILRLICFFFNILSYLYIFLCFYINLPLRKYFLNVYAKLSFMKKNYTIFDQLNPKYAKYYKKNEIIELLKKSKFNNIKIYHRHNYSWTVIAQKI